MNYEPAESTTDMFGGNSNNLMFNEYFHGDNAACLGASHQTGWTGIVADVIRRRHQAVRSIGDMLRTMAGPGR